MITIKQLSIFLENKNGRINDVAKVLAKDSRVALRSSRLPRCRKYLYRIHVCILRGRYGTNNHSSHRSKKMYRNITEEPL